MKPFTVIFFVDGDYAVETFVEKVMASNASEAWSAAVRQAKEDGSTSTGRELSKNQWECATEIVTFDGHLEPTKNWSSTDA